MMESGIAKWLFLLCFLSETVTGLMFTVMPNNRRCIMEGVHGGDVVIGEFNVTRVPGLEISYVITDLSGHVLARHENVTRGKFSVATETDDVMELCLVSSRSDVDIWRTRFTDSIHTVSLALRTVLSLESSTPGELLEYLEPLERELLQCEALASHVVRELDLMRQRQTVMTSTNESTMNKLFYLSCLSAVVLASTSAFQVLYLRNYFKERKLL